MDVELAPGSLFLGRYQVEALLGRGGMGEVWAATDVELDRPVALKLIRRKYADHPEYARRFRRETKVVARLEHANIVHLYDASVTPDGRLYMVMQRLHGMTLRAAVDRSRRIDLVTAVFYAIQIAEALGVAHAVGIWHRDIKPENVMIGDDGRAWVLDFGIAKEARERSTGPRADAKGNAKESDVLGTSRYMAPELVSGQKGDHRADLYALGVVLYEMVTGLFPYGEFAHADETLVLAAHVFGEARPIQALVPELPESLWLVVSKLLEKKPEERYGEVEPLVADLRAVVRESVPPEHPVARRVAQDRTEQARKRAFDRRRVVNSVPPGSYSAVAEDTALTVPTPRLPVESQGGGTEPIGLAPLMNETAPLPLGFVPANPAWSSRPLAASVPPAPRPETIGFPVKPASQDHAGSPSLVRGTDANVGERPPRRDVGRVVSVLVGGLALFGLVMLLVATLQPEASSAESEATGEPAMAGVPTVAAPSVPAETSTTTVTIVPVVAVSVAVVPTIPVPVTSASASSSTAAPETRPGKVSRTKAKVFPTGYEPPFALPTERQRRSSNSPLF